MKNLLRSLAAFALLALLAAPLVAQVSNVSLPGRVSLGAGTATGTSNAATLANKAGVITTESVTTAAGATFLETITATGVIAATDLCFASVSTGGTGTPAVTKVTPTANTLAILIQNVHASAAFNNTLAITYLCFKP